MVVHNTQEDLGVKMAPGVGGLTLGGTFVELLYTKQPVVWFGTVGCTGQTYLEAGTWLTDWNQSNRYIATDKRVYGLGSFQQPRTEFLTAHVDATGACINDAGTSVSVYSATYTGSSATPHAEDELGTSLL